MLDRSIKTAAGDGFAAMEVCADGVLAGRVEEAVEIGRFAVVAGEEVVEKMKKMGTDFDLKTQNLWLNGEKEGN
ncbi:hypothetical protein E3N88_03782 [Mikania micrantha]|uniref:Uncharacterized protein n=1 Tax=Mikania micrantha TaxID=192012 RepID=A0A5N6PSF9_9ASTR|nr:hypothetical protein E3N88_03782 [Mikania micrantha]